MSPFYGWLNTQASSDGFIIRLLHRLAKGKGLATPSSVIQHSSFNTRPNPWKEFQWPWLRLDQNIHPCCLLNYKLSTARVSQSPDSSRGHKAWRQRHSCAMKMTPDDSQQFCFERFIYKNNRLHCRYRKNYHSILEFLLVTRAWLSSHQTSLVLTTTSDVSDSHEPSGQPRFSTAALTAAS